MRLVQLGTASAKPCIASAKDYAVVGKGFTAEVRSYDGGRVVKLFENWVPDFNIDRDAYLKRYFQLQPGARREILTWRPALMAGVAVWRERRRV